jgi:hypothetical protein
LVKTAYSTLVRAWRILADAQASGLAFIFKVLIIELKGRELPPPIYVSKRDGGIADKRVEVWALQVLAIGEGGSLVADAALKAHLAQRVSV